MKKFIYIFLLLWGPDLRGQTYVPMPTDSGAAWRYRFYEVDDFVTVIDFILYLDGRDTVINGHTYSRIYCRQYTQYGPFGFDPPVVADTANTADIFYGAIRDSAQKVYFVTVSSEQMIFDFTAAIGSYIPAYSSPLQVVSIDSVLIGSTYHKRFKTTDTSFYAVEGVGSNLGLLPPLNDGSGTVTFYCYSNVPETWSPDTSLPCTTIYPGGGSDAVKMIKNAGNLNTFPNPAHDYLHLEQNDGQLLHGIIVNCFGQRTWEGDLGKSTTIPVSGLPPGIYYLHCYGDDGNSLSKKISIE